MSDFDTEFNEFLEKQGLNEDDLSVEEHREQLDDFALENQLARQTEEAKFNERMVRGVNKAKANEELGGLQKRADEIAKELLGMDQGDPWNSSRRDELFEEIQKIGPRIDNLKAAAPFVHLSDEALAREVEESNLRTEDLRAQAKTAAAQRPNLAEKLTKEADAAFQSWAEFETEQRRRNGDRLAVDFLKAAESGKKLRAEAEAQRTARGQQFSVSSDIPAGGSRRKEENG
jgi:hypothetical protein